MNLLTLDEYQELAATTAVYPPDHGINYNIHGLTNEAGEVAGAYKKFLRGDYDEAAMKKKLEKELGDVLWYLANAARESGFMLSDIAGTNLQKLQDRKSAGTLMGEGDNR